MTETTMLHEMTRLMAKAQEAETLRTENTRLRAEVHSLRMEKAAKPNPATEALLADREVLLREANSKITFLEERLNQQEAILLSTPIDPTRDRRIEELRAEAEAARAETDALLKVIASAHARLNSALYTTPSPTLSEEIQ